MNKVQIRNLTVSNQFHISSIDLYMGDFYAILGSSNQEEKTLISVLKKKIPYEGTVYIDNQEFRNVSNYNRIIEVIGGRNFVFEEETVFKQLEKTLKKQGFSYVTIHEKIQSFLTFFDVNQYENTEIHYLSNSKKAMLAFISSIIKEPSFLILDDSFMQMDSYDKRKCIMYLKEQSQKRKMIILYYTTCIEDLLEGIGYLLFQRGTLLTAGNLGTFIMHVPFLEQIGYSMPFLFDLSYKLSYYGLIKEPILNMEEMVAYLWK